MELSRLVDAHVHTWPGRERAGEYPPAPTPWTDRLLAVDASIERLLAVLDEHGVGRAVLVQAPWNDAAHRYLADAIAGHPGRVTGVCLLDPRSDTAATDLARLHAAGFRGLRLHLTTAEEQSCVLEEGGAAVLRRAGELGMPVNLLYRDQELHQPVAALAAGHPETRLIIDHLGHVTPGGATMLLPLADLANVFVKVSLHNELSGIGFPWRDLDGVHEQLLAAFGADRLLWGSNWPMHIGSSTYGQRLSVIHGLPAQVGSATARWLYWGEAPPRRVAWRLRIREGQEDEYRRAHREIGLELRAGMRRMGIRNYSIYADGRDLFLYLELAGAGAERQTERRDDWEQRMSAVVEPGRTMLEEVFHLD